MHVVSDFPLPELLPWAGLTDCEPDLRLRYGAVPDRLEDADYVGPVFQTKGDLYLLAIPGSARFLVRGGREVWVQPVDGGEEVDARAILSGTIQGVIYHQRGFFPLHASTVLRKGKAIAIAAPSGGGKSTLAAALSARGLTVMGDDICVIEISSYGVQVIPTYPKLRLWRDAVDALGFDAESFSRALSGKEKYLVDRAAGVSAGPAPLGDVVLLLREPSRHELSLERLRGTEAVQAIATSIYVRRAASALRLQRNLFTSAARVAVQSRIWRLTVPDAVVRLTEAADAICRLPVS